MSHTMMVWACIASLWSLAPEVGLLEIAVAAEKKADRKTAAQEPLNRPVLLSLLV